jgi:hypothetical protein
VAYEVSKLDDPEAQREVAARVVAEGLSRSEVVRAVRRAASRPTRAGGGKGRGAKGKPNLPTTRIIRTEAGSRLTVEYRKGLDHSVMIAAVEEALAGLRAEQGDDQVAA